MACAVFVFTLLCMQIRVSVELRKPRPLHLSLSAWASTESRGWWDSHLFNSIHRWQGRKTETSITPFKQKRPLLFHIEKPHFQLTCEHLWTYKVRVNYFQCGSYYRKYQFLLSNALAGEKVNYTAALFCSHYLNRTKGGFILRDTGDTTLPVSVVLLAWLRTCSRQGPLVWSITSTPKCVNESNKPFVKVSALAAALPQQWPWPPMCLVWFGGPPFQNQGPRWYKKHPSSSKPQVELEVHRQPFHTLGCGLWGLLVEC